MNDGICSLVLNVVFNLVSVARFWLAYLNKNTAVFFSASAYASKPFFFLAFLSAHFYFH